MKLIIILLIVLTSCHSTYPADWKPRPKQKMYLGHYKHKICYKF